MSQSFLVDEISREGILDNSIPKKERSAFKQIMGVQRKLLPPFASFQVPTAQNNIPKQHIWEWHILLLIPVHKGTKCF